MRRGRLAVALVMVLAVVGCGGAGSIGTAPVGQVRSLLHVVDREDRTETQFTGLAAAPGGTAYLGVIPDSYDFDGNPRILALRPGQRPKIVLEVKEESLAGVDNLETSALAVGRDGELFVAGYTDTALVILGIRPDGRKRVIQGPPMTHDDSRAGRYAVALAVDPRNGDLYLADDCSVFRAPEGGSFTVLAGGAEYGDCNIFNNPKPPVLHSFSKISGMAVDPRNGAVYVSDGAIQVHRIDGSAIAAVAGRAKTDTDTRFRGFSGDGGPATEARLDGPGALAFDASTGDLYICDEGNKRLRKVDANGTITTVAGNGTVGGPGFDGKATEVSVDATQVAIDGRGRVYVTRSRSGSTYRHPTARRLAVTSVRRS